MKITKPLNLALLAVAGLTFACGGGEKAAESTAETAAPAAAVAAATLHAVATVAVALHQARQKPGLVFAVCPAAAPVLNPPALAVKPVAAPVVVAAVVADFATATDIAVAAVAHVVPQPPPGAAV